MSERSELLRSMLDCPLCGSPAGLGSLASGGPHNVACIECNERGPYDATEAGAIRLWNERAKQIKTEIERQRKS